MNILKPALIGFGAMALLWGCGSGDNTDSIDPNCTDGKCDGIHPGDTAGYLQVELPSVSSDVTMNPFKIAFGSGSSHLEVTPGQKIKLAPQKDCLSLYSGAWDEPSAIKDCNVTIESKKVTIYRLSAVVFSDDPEKFLVEVGPRAKVSLSSYKMENNQDKEYATSFGGYRLDLPESNKPRGITLLQGRYNLTFRPSILVEMKQAFEVGQGEVKTMDLTPSKEYRATIVVKAPVRQLPNPTELSSCPDCQVNHHFINWRSDRGYPIVEPGIYHMANINDFNVSDANIGADGYSQGCYTNQGFKDIYVFDLIQDTKVRMYPFVADVDYTGKVDSAGQLFHGNHYEYVTNNTWYFFEPISGQETIVEGQHLDLFNLEIEATPGQIETVAASYTISYRPLDSALAFSKLGQFSSFSQGYSSCTKVATFNSFKTESGLDVVPGVYQVRFDYSINNKSLYQIFECELRTPSISGQDRCTQIE